MIEQSIEIINKLGLHARAASALVDTATHFQCKVDISFNGKTVDGKSIMSVMLLAAAKGSVLVLRCDGKDEEQAMAALCELINNYFGEGE